MKTTKIACALSLIVMHSVIGSCNTPNDPTDPADKVSVIDSQKPSISINGVKDGERFKLAEKIKVGLKLSDNVGLASWRLDVTAPDKTADKEKWEKVLKNLKGEVSGREALLDKEVEIPGDVELGKYQIIAYAEDLSGNSSSTKSLNIELLDKDGYNESGYNENGFNREGRHKDTGTEFDPDGYDKQGFDRDDNHRDTGTKLGPDGYDKQGFDKECKHRDTGTIYGPDGYTKWGVDKDCKDRNGEVVIDCMQI